MLAQLDGRELPKQEPRRHEVLRVREAEELEAVLCRSCGRTYGLAKYLVESLRGFRSPMPLCDRCGGKGKA